MSNKKNTTFKQIVSILSELHGEYPNDNLGRHISLALSDYPDLFSVSDKELLFAFEKYQTELALDLKTVASDDYVRRIEEDASHLFDKQEDDEWEENEE